MNFDFGAVFGQVVSLYARLPLAQKIAIPVLIAGSMGLIIFVSQWASRPDYGVLFSGLQENDAAAVVEKLKDDKIAFRLRDDGKTVEVSPPDIIHELRLQLAAGGLPRGGSVGYELFNESSLGRTGFVEKLTFIRALQGELERTIQSIDAVRSVRVHITKPKRSVFVKRDVLPTASVLLRLKAGSELDGQQVKGIANLVANSVERLTADNVTVVDSHGKMLNQKSTSGAMMAGSDSTKLQYKSRIEDEYSRRIETMLTEVLGPGKAVARVTADIDFSKYEKEEEAYDPGGQVVRSSREVQEAAGLGAAGGVPGVISNLTNDPGVLTPPNSGENGNNRRETVTNYEVSRAVSRTTSAPGAITRLSVAVLVDGQYSADGATDGGNDAAAAKTYVPLQSDTLRKIEGLVKQTVGFDVARGDTVTVENIRFFEPDESIEDALARAETQDLIFRGVSWALPALFILLFFMMVMKPLIRFLVSPTEAEVDLSRLLPAGIEELEAELEQERSKLMSSADVAAPAVDIEELESLLAENSKLVSDSPQQAALLIRYWLNDGRL